MCHLLKRAREVIQAGRPEPGFVLGGERKVCGEMQYYFIRLNDCGVFTAECFYNRKVFST